MERMIRGWTGTTIILAFMLSTIDVAWAAEGQSVFFTAGVNQQADQLGLKAFLSEILIQGGYDPNDYLLNRVESFRAGYFIPAATVLTPHRERTEVSEVTTIGLVYLLQPLQFEDQLIMPGLIPVSVHILRKVTTGKAISASDGLSANMSCTAGVDVTSGKPSVTCGFTVEAPIPNFVAPIQDFVDIFVQAWDKFVEDWNNVCVLC